MHIGLGTVLGALLAPLPWLGTGAAADPGQANILWSLRFPRVVLGVLVGGTLAIAGAAYQGVFRNPLADPYLLGAAAGANLGATLAIAFAPGMSLLGVNIVPLAAFVGAGVAVAGAYALGRSVTGLRSTTGLILAGVALAATGSALTGLGEAGTAALLAAAALLLYAGFVASSQRSARSLLTLRSRYRLIR